MSRRISKPRFFDIGNFRPYIVIRNRIIPCHFIVPHEKVMFTAATAIVAFVSMSDIIIDVMHTVARGTV